MTVQGDHNVIGIVHFFIYPPPLEEGVWLQNSVSCGWYTSYSPWRNTVVYQSYVRSCMCTILL